MAIHLATPLPSWSTKRTRSFPSIEETRFTQNWRLKRERPRLASRLGKYALLLCNLLICRPAIEKVEEIIQLIDLGTNLIRFNQSYGNVKSNSKLFKMFFEAKKLRPHKNVAIMLELAGREVRISNFKQPDGGKDN
jgi:hypothetical protein